MHPFRLLSAPEQVAAHLRRGLEQGRWSEVIPGVKRLAKELEVNHKTVEAALRQLKREGLLKGRGQGRRRLIVQTGETTGRAMRIGLLTYDPMALVAGYWLELHHLLLAAGHAAVFAEKSQQELGMDVGRITRLVTKTAADAWVIDVGSRGLLEWICTQPTPAFALFGRREGLPIAATGPDKPPAYAAAARHLIRLGHRRIVLLTRAVRRLPEPGRSERAFLAELQAHGIPVGEYNLPGWEETLEGFQGLLCSLFQVSPPTALIVDEAPFFIATQQFLARRGLGVPEQVSLVCTDADPAFAWCEPRVSHIRWDSGPVVRRIVSWAANVSRGRRDVRQSRVPAEFVVAGTTGSAPAD